MFIKRVGLEKYLAQMNKPERTKPANPYVEQLSREFLAIYQEDGSEWERRIAQHVLDTLIAPKNERIHKLTSDLMRLQASLHKLDQVLATHNAGVCRDGESPVDCAIRLLSPVPDSVPARDRP